MSAPLYVFGGEKLVGKLEADATQRLRFTYDPSWLLQPDATALSLTMPLRAEPYDYPVPQNFFENLLPEAEVRASLERGFKLATDSPYQFLKEFGDDAAGAFTVRRSEQPVATASIPTVREIPWAYVDAVIEAGRQLYEAVARDFGAKFSLAGAQDKLVLLYDAQADKIFVPTGHQPTSHILKIDLRFKNSETVCNEFFCLDLAKRIGLPTVQAQVHAGKHPTLIIERYDRDFRTEQPRRLHQEDLCQALGQASALKYEDKGGKGFRHYYELVKQHSGHPIQDLDLLLKWLCFNVVIGNNDAHGKNLAFFYQRAQPALAPFYDLLATTIYPQFDSRMAFSIGGCFQYRSLRKVHFDAAAKEFGMRSDRLLATFRQTVVAVEGALAPSAAALTQVAPWATVGERINEAVRKRIEHFHKSSDLMS